MNGQPAQAPITALLSQLVEEHSGLHWAAGERDTLIERVRDRASELGLESLLDYYYYVRYDEAGPQELDQLVDTLVVGETYLFRELAALRVAVERFVKPRVDAKERPRIWCAACSTGEEAYTLAMLLGQQDLLGKVDLVASDLSGRSLQRARRGELGRRSLRDVPSPALVARWTVESPEGARRVTRDIVDAIEWRRINLRSARSVASVGPCDVILCRNVLIYFSDATAGEVVQSLSQQLKRDGALFVGVSESLLRLGTALECEELDGVFYYRKPE
jgi:chemotaxis protein methyltransferase CheR